MRLRVRLARAAGPGVAKVYGPTNNGGKLRCMVYIDRKWLLLVTHTVELMTSTDADGAAVRP